MPLNCSVFRCKNYFKKGGGVQFFGFPLKNDDLVKSWIVNIRRPEFTPNKSSKVCSDHFREEDYLVRPGTYIRRLKPDAVPTIFSCLSKKLQIETRHQRGLEETKLDEVIDKDPLEIDQPIASTSATIPKLERIPTDYEGNHRDVLEKDRISSTVPEPSNVPKNVDKTVQTTAPEPSNVPKKVNKTVQTRRKFTDERVILKIRNLQQQVRRQNRKITKLKQLVKTLRTTSVLVVEEEETSSSSDTPSVVRNFTKHVLNHQKLDSLSFQHEV